MFSKGFGAIEPSFVILDPDPPPFTRGGGGGTCKLVLTNILCRSKSPNKENKTANHSEELQKFTLTANSKIDQLSCIESNVANHRPQPLKQTQSPKQDLITSQKTSTEPKWSKLSTRTKNGANGSKSSKVSPNTKNGAYSLKLVPTST